MMNLFQPRRQGTARPLFGNRQPLGNRQMLINQQRFFQPPQPQMGFQPVSFPQPQPQGMLPKAQPQNDPMIKFEPLDEETMKQLKVIQGGKPEPESVSGTMKDGSVKDGEAKEKQAVIGRDDVTVTAQLGQFIQNERNAGIYYDKLAEKAPDEFSKNALKHIAENSRKNVSLYGSIYKDYKGADFEAQEEEVEAEINFMEGIRLAIMEENNMLNDLTNIYDIIKNDRIIQLLHAPLQKKHSTISNLFLMNMKFH